ncbi:armadillo repeat-containing protein 4 [Eurytemora carolleeae]|uniref:armadillo repeat-containing protein 4 n=1 Tax=Eurytemora carolleeae TaxID=1294199 RepID=UPI000C784A41|nr:armadillo repeat-containing protein 4 [Eurytemora carolleeae]|eukprot:XP_023333865.1 armadillo repeat-containing protein 4-like [Eurytemora affinis]
MPGLEIGTTGLGCRRRISVGSRSSVMSPVSYSGSQHHISVKEEMLSSSSDDEEEEEENMGDMKPNPGGGAGGGGGGDLPQEYWQVQKLVRYLKVGNQTATIIALCNIADFDLKAQYCQMSIIDAGGLEVLANLLETEDVKCQIGSLKILKDIVVHPDIRKSITKMGGIELMVRILSDSNKKLKLHAAESLAKLAKFKKGRRIVRKNNGIPKIVDLLDVDTSKPENHIDATDADLSLDMQVARGGCYALWSLCKSKKNRLLIKRAGGFPLLAKLIKTKNISLLIPVIGSLQECAAEKSYCLAIQKQ